MAVSVTHGAIAWQAVANDSNSHMLLPLNRVLWQSARDEQQQLDAVLPRACTSSNATMLGAVLWPVLRKQHGVTHVLYSHHQYGTLGGDRTCFSPNLTTAVPGRAMPLT